MEKITIKDKTFRKFIPYEKISAAIDTVADKMNVLAEDMQVISITHLPVVAARASSHFYVSKSSDSTHTFTSIEKLGIDKRIEVIASMIAGKDSKGAIISAKELLNV